MSAKGRPEREYRSAQREGSPVVETPHREWPAFDFGPLTEANVRTRVAPLFARVLHAHPGRIYLANHSLGRPPDRMEDDVREALAAWYGDLGGAWDAWLAEIGAYRARLATLAGAPRPDCIVPKASAGQGLRAVLNAHDRPPRVVSTQGEFDSLDLILREYARRGRVALTLVAPRDDGMYADSDVVDAIVRGVDLVVVSEVMFQTGQRLPELPAIVARAHEAGARVLLDVYHSLGVLPVDLAALDVDFAVGGGYKYLRGGPGACFLYVHPRHLDGALRPLDTGWFAKENRFDYARPDPPRFAAGGDAWLESTPPVLPFYQARAGQMFTLAIGVARLRDHSLAQQRRLVATLAAHGIDALGGTEDRGAFVAVAFREPGGADAARRSAAALAARDVVADARGPWLRLCPDVLTTDDELTRAAGILAEVRRA
jgi:kynureninase